MAPNCDPEGTRLETERPPPSSSSISKKLAFGINAWDAGCGLESIGFEADCPWGSTCYGTCAGKTPARCKSKYDMTCEISIKINPIDSIGDSRIRNALKRFLPNAEAGVKLGYTFVSKTVSITAYGKFEAGHMGRRRQMLAAGDAPFSELSSDVCRVGRTRAGSHLSGSRTQLELLWRQGTVRGRGIAASVEGTGRYTIPTKQFSFAVSVAGESACSLLRCLGLD